MYNTIKFSTFDVIPEVNNNVDTEEQPNVNSNVEEVDVPEAEVPAENGDLPVDGDSDLDESNAVDGENIDNDADTNTEDIGGIPEGEFENGDMTGGFEGEMIGDGFPEVGMPEVKNPLMSSWVFVGGITGGVLALSIGLGVILAKIKIKKGIELYED